jgi:hypothetical protein
VFKLLIGGFKGRDGMGTRTKVLATLALAGACGVLAVPSMASAARSGVTIHLYQGAGFEGFVFSPKPGQCADGRTVKVFKQTGKGQNPKRDKRVARTHAFKNSGGKYRWHALHHQPHPGKYYARVSATSGCQADNSKTLHISARPNTKITDVSISRNKRQVIFEYKGSGGLPPYRYKCKLDDRPYNHCQGNSKLYKNVSRGHHVFKVRAVGHNGKSDRTPAKRGFRM